MLTKADHDKIADAVRKAEAGTSGEILCVLAQSVSNYRETPLAWGAGAALLLPPIVLALGVRLAPDAATGWDAGAGGLDAAVRTVLSGYALLQISRFRACGLGDRRLQAGQTGPNAEHSQAQARSSGSHGAAHGYAAAGLADRGGCGDLCVA